MRLHCLIFKYFIIYLFKSFFKDFFRALLVFNRFCGADGTEGQDVKANAQKLKG